MNENPIENVVGGKVNLYMLVFLSVTGVLLLGSWWVIAFVNSQVQEPEPVAELSPIYVNYRVDVDEYVSAESYLAMAAYQQEFEQPQNVQVLTGLNTQEINGYMMNHFVAGMHVNCTYCHSLENFSLDEWGNDEESNLAEQRKITARRHLELVQDLNVNWLATLGDTTDLKDPSGAQMTCAVCHNGQAQPEPWPANEALLEQSFIVALEGELTAENEDTLNVNARRDISLDMVQNQQNVMYHMNRSMNVGCTHCHNSRYFPLRDVPAIHYAQHMLLMTQHIWVDYAESMANKEPSCTMCHQGQIIPPGAAISVDVMPDALVASE